VPSLTQFPSGMVATDFLRATLNAMTVPAVDALLAQLPVTDVNRYHYDAENPEKGWVEGNFHWIPVGRDRGNAGRIKLAGKPVYPLAERLVNGMEALIELKRLRELAVNKDTAPPQSPREAVKRYFGLPPLDQIPKLKANGPGKAIHSAALDLSRQLHLSVKHDEKLKDFAVSIRDYGMGQTAVKMHRTLLSLGTSDKGDKPYLIGVFGQGGSSTYAASKCSWIVTRRAPDILGSGELDSVGWSVVRHILPKGNRASYFAYLAVHSDGRVLALPAAAADAVEFKHGSQFCHVGYDFGSFGSSSIGRSVFPALNHVLYNPVLPFFTSVGETEATVWGHSYRLSRRKLRDPEVLDKTFDPRPVEIDQ
jgi:hypothetical protein